MKATCYILKGGLKHYFDFKEGDVFYIDIKRNRIYPIDKRIECYDEIFIVDDLITDGRNLLKAYNILKSKGCSNIVKVGSCLTDFARKIVDIELDKPEIKGYLLVYSGFAGSGKSMLSYSLHKAFNIPRIKIGSYARKFDFGKYGEKLFELEKINPFVLVEKVVEDLKDIKDEFIIIDGVKNIDQLTFLSYTLKRVTIGFFVNTPEHIRKIVVKMRGDFDDYYDNERRKLFMKWLNELRKYMFEVNIYNENSSRVYVKLISKLFNKQISNYPYPNIFITKRNILEFYKYSMPKFKPVEIKFKIDYHTSYLDKLKDKNLGKEERDLIKYTATSFRIIDDILDENTIRNFKKTTWVRYGITKSLLIAINLICHAREISKSLGLENEFFKMFNEVTNSVLLELEYEENRNKEKNIETWLKIAKKEAYFRWFIAKIINENEWKYYLLGLIAQAKDDLIGERKGGREATERRLNRVLIQDVAYVTIDKIENLKRIAKGIDVKDENHAINIFLRFIKNE